MPEPSLSHCLSVSGAIWHEPWRIRGDVSRQGRCQGALSASRQMGRGRTESPSAAASDVHRQPRSTPHSLAWTSSIRRQARRATVGRRLRSDRQHERMHGRGIQIHKTAAGSDCSYSSNLLSWTISIYRLAPGFLLSPAKAGWPRLRWFYGAI